MSNTLPVFDENSKPICYGSPRPLQELASIKMALNIWLQKFSENDKGANIINIAKLDFRFEGSSAVPLKIQKMINSKMYLITSRLNWLVKYLQSVLRYLSYDEIYDRFNLVVFGGNGAIHFKDTIANFLEDDSLDIETRFEIAYVNCVEEKIDLFWPLVSNELNVDDLRFDDDFMLCYWICRKRGELNRIPLRSFSCVEFLMIEMCRPLRFYLAIEYFLTLLSPDDRLFQLEQLSKHEDENLMDLLPSIDGPTQRQILDKCSTRILYHFAKRFEPADYAVQCFIYIRDTITPEFYCREVIINLIKFVRLHTMHSLRITPKPKEENFRCQQFEIALAQIWLNTPTHLKAHTLENLSKIFKKYNKKYYTDCLPDFGRSIRFLLAMLSDADFALRNSFWKENWPRCFVGVPPFQFEELMELCLMNIEAIENFKSTFPYTEEFKFYCSELICEGYFAELDEFLSSLYSNHDLVLSIKKHILTNETEIFSKETEAIEKYAKYIDNIFSNNALAADFKENIVCSEPILKILSRSIFDDELDSVELTLSLFVSPQKISELKKKFLEIFRDKITNGQLHVYHGSTREDFLMWCLDSDERVDDFMKSLQIDAVFEAAVREYFKCDRSSQSDQLSSLGRFLRRYFKPDGDLMKFIRQRIKYYEGMDTADVERIFGVGKQIVLDFMKIKCLRLFLY